MANRYFVENIQGETATIEGADAIHLAKVLRAKPGDTLWLCNGKGHDYLVKVREILPKTVLCDVLESCDNKNEAALQVALYVAFGKGDKMDWVVQKAVELGAISITPFFAERCVSRPKKDKQERFFRIAEEAAKQSARGIIPKIFPSLSFSEMLQAACQNDAALLFHPSGETKLANAIQNMHTLSLITGPEGGFTQDEVEQAKNSGCPIVGLGPRILRCETAPIASLAAVMALAQEW